MYILKLDGITMVTVSVRVRRGSRISDKWGRGSVSHQHTPVTTAIVITTVIVIIITITVDMQSLM